MFCSNTAFAPSDAMGAKQWQEPALRCRVLRPVGLKKKKKRKFD